MTKAYDKHYRDGAYFGEPYPGLVEFFSAFEPKGTVLDLGCGQGRDALLLGRLGYRVTGVDSSALGIKQMNKAAARENLPVEGVVADMHAYPIDNSYDMILLDSMFHFYLKDRNKEEAFLLQILTDLKDDGILCNYMQQGEDRERIYKKALAESGFCYEVIAEGYTVYPEYEGKIHYHISRKQTGRNENLKEVAD